MRRYLIPVIITAAVSTATCAPGLQDAGQDQSLDVLITGARIVDGAGNPWFRGDVGIRDDRIAAVGHLADWQATRTIDAAGRVVSPGFIDMMGQSSLVLVTDPASAES
ncbi:MAG: hypothetical protein VX815_07235, partial [Gemmatimonadota bacterium]|nr:hypothetical protein [Gemmatimonadota bacterium]